MNDSVEVYTAEVFELIEEIFQADFETLVSNAGGIHLIEVPACHSKP